MKKLKISINPLFVLLGIVLVLTGDGFAFVAYTITVVLHEAAHSEAARRRGFVLDDLRLMPYGAEIGGSLEGIKTRDEIAVALAGPAFNLFLAVLFTALFWLVPSTYFFTETFVAANLVTGLLNLLPVFPMDGGRIFLAALSSKMQRSKALKIARITGLIIGGVFVLGFVVSIFFSTNITLLLIAIFMLIGAFLSYRKEGYKRIISRAYRSKSLQKGLSVREVVVPLDMPLYAVNKLLHSHYYYRISVVDKSLCELKSITETEFEQLLLQHASSEEIGKLLIRPKLPIH